MVWSVAWRSFVVPCLQRQFYLFFRILLTSPIWTFSIHTASFLQFILVSPPSLATLSYYTGVDFALWLAWLEFPAVSRSRFHVVWTSNWCLVSFLPLQPYPHPHYLPWLFLEHLSRSDLVQLRLFSFPQTQAVWVERFSHPLDWGVGQKLWPKARIQLPSTRSVCFIGVPPVVPLRLAVRSKPKLCPYSFRVSFLAGHLSQAISSPRLFSIFLPSTVQTISSSLTPNFTLSGCGLTFHLPLGYHHLLTMGWSPHANLECTTTRRGGS